MLHNLTQLTQDVKVALSNANTEAMIGGRKKQEKHDFPLLV